MPRRARSATTGTRLKARKEASDNDMMAAGPGPDGQMRCMWANADVSLIAYHDEVWGQPPKSDDEYFERMMFEVFHAGLNWRLVWNKRVAINEAMQNFNVKKLANLTPRDIDALMENAAIIRNRKKFEATVHNARTILDLQDSYGSFANWLKALPPPEAEKHAALKKSFKFVGPGVSHSFLEASGLIPTPHHPYCFKASKKAARA